MKIFPKAQAQTTDASPRVGASHYEIAEYTLMHRRLELHAAKMSGYPPDFGRDPFQAVELHPDEFADLRTLHELHLAAAR